MWENCAHPAAESCESQTPADLETHLDVHLDDGFPNQSGAKEGPKGHQEVAAGYPSQVEQRVGNLQAQNKREPTRLTPPRPSHQQWVVELTEAQAKMPKKPTFCTRCWTPSLALEAKSCTDEKKV